MSVEEAEVARTKAQCQQYHIYYLRKYEQLVYLFNQFKTSPAGGSAWLLLLSRSGRMRETLWPDTIWLNRDKSAVVPTLISYHSILIISNTPKPVANIIIFSLTSFKYKYLGFLYGLTAISNFIYPLCKLRPIIKMMMMVKTETDFNVVL